ncbi:MATE family efflux transporter [Thaumasiovibrio subtropicus]|uniref:MATE family efflux transporter n=1 Tax=Thaumasiovibrio subtropicus TaxID=1891207 RepID=UPI000B34DBD3|nr:MATE family efflux transporter [Thaumasiovibrio subtropicus]
MGVASTSGIDISNQSIGKALFKFAVPSTLAVWVFAMYTMVDGMFVGRGVGPEALAAVNLSMPFINIMFAISILITIGAGTIVGKLKGEGKQGQANRIFSSAIYFLAGFGALVCFIAYLSVDQVAYMLGARGELIPMVSEYLGTLLFFQTFYLMAYSMEVFAKIDGFPQRELAAILCAAVTNIVLDYILVIHMGWGLRGAAIATGSAQMLQMTLLIFHFKSRSSNLRFVRAMPDLQNIKRFVKIGTPDSITEMSAGFVLMAFNNAILFHMGTPELSAFSVIGYINNFMLITFIGLTQGMQPIVTFSRGRKDTRSMCQVAVLTVKVVLVISALAYAGVYVYGDNLARLFLEDPELVYMSHQAMKVFCLGFIFLGVNVVVSGFFTALESPKKAGVISLLRGFILVMLLLLVLPNVFGPESIWWVTAGAELVTVLVSIRLLGRWLKLNAHKVLPIDPAVAN